MGRPRALIVDTVKAKQFTQEGRERLRRHAWPGNVRELKKVVRRAFIMADQDLGLDALRDAASGKSSLLMPVGTPLIEAERRLILAALDQYEGDKRKVASVLQISLNTLYARLNEYKAN